jgi:hypothetical protein
MQTQEDNIKMDVRRTDCEVVDRTETAKDRVQWRAIGNITINLDVPLK